jgi:multidrug transporter EmrE-like cation transporter
MKRIAKAKRERIAGMLGLVVIVLGMFTASLDLPQTIPIALCVSGVVTLGVTHHFSQRP